MLNLKLIKELLFILPLLLIGGPAKGFQIEDFKYFKTNLKKTVEQVQYEDFISSQNHELNFGYTTDEIWVSFTLQTSPNDDNHIIYLNKPLLDSITLHFEKDGGWVVLQTGILTEDEKYKRRTGYYFEIEQGLKNQKVLLKSVGTKSQNFEIKLITEQEKIIQELKGCHISGIVLGSFLMMIVYNIFLGIGIRDRVYFYYALSGGCSLLATITLLGFWNTNEMISSIKFKEFMMPFSTGFSSVFWGIFCIQFLKIKEDSLLAYRLLLFSIVLSSVGTMVLYFLNIAGHPTSYKLISIFSLLFFVVAINAGIQSYRRGKKKALFYLIAWGVFLLGVCVLSFNVLGIIPNNTFTRNIYWVTSIFEMLFMSIALSSRYKLLQKEKLDVENKLRLKSYDLSRIVLDHNQRNAYKAALSERLSSILNMSNEDYPSALKSLIYELKDQDKLELRQDKLFENISQINAEFNNKLKSKFPSLTAGEIEICGYVLTGLTDQQIAGFRQTSSEAIKTARYRIRKKMGLEKDESIENVLKDL